jgi:hypothetical protein
MSEKPRIRGYINPTVPGTTEAGQREGMTPDIDIYVEDRRGKMIDALVRSIRKGTIVEVMETYCLAPAEGRADVRRRALADRIEAIKARGGIIRETVTGHVSKGNLARMTLRAYEQIASSGRARSRDKIGRPRKQWTPEQLQTMEAVWNSRRYHNDPERMDAIRERIGKSPSRSWLRLRFGSPHRMGNETEVDARPLRVRRKAKSRVYFLRDGKTVKIGHGIRGS